MIADENPVIANIKTRRSVREYLDMPLSEETIKKIIDAGRYAPTGLNLQPWRFMVVQNKEMLKKLSDYAKPILVKNLEGRNDAGESALPAVCDAIEAEVKSLLSS